MDPPQPASTSMPEGAPLADKWSRTHSRRPTIIIIMIYFSLRLDLVNAPGPLQMREDFLNCSRLSRNQPSHLPRKFGFSRKTNSDALNWVIKLDDQKNAIIPVFSSSLKVCPSSEQVFSINFSTFLNTLPITYRLQLIFGDLIRQVIITL